MTSRRGLLDALLGAVLAVTLLGTAVALAGSWGGTSWLLDLVIGVTVGVLALRRHRHPAAYAVAGSAVALAGIVAARLTHLPHEPGPATVLALAVLVTSAIRWERPHQNELRVGGLPRAAVAAGCGLVVVVVAGLCTRPYGSGLDVITVLAALGWLTAVAAGLGLRLRDAQRRAALDEVRRDERLDLARELHDLAAHHLTGLVLKAQAARVVARQDASRVDDELAGIETSGADALTAMRRVVGLLRDSSEDGAPTLPGPPSPAELIRNFTARPGAPEVRATLGPFAPASDDRELPPAVRSTVYRIVQEGLTNVLRHASQARTVDIAVHRSDDELTVTIADDGPARSYRSGYGLIGMAERVHALGGRLEAGPRPGGGWAITAAIRVVP
ncbi:histidine kinase [Actinoplanes sp. NPDC051411]|uniref:sensor histidine kinase n=1 Tax=Actinoplanes sp. NPDC051411 TaxID=3155522 RepID=UPI00344564C0